MQTRPGDTWFPLYKYTPNRRARFVVDLVFFVDELSAVVGVLCPDNMYGHIENGYQLVTEYTHGNLIVLPH